MTKGATVRQESGARQAEAWPAIIVELERDVASQRAAEDRIEPRHPDAVDDAGTDLVEDHVALAVAIQIRVVELHRVNVDQAQEIGRVGADAEVRVAARAVVARHLRDPHSGRPQLDERSRR